MKIHAYENRPNMSVYKDILYTEDVCCASKKDDNRDVNTGMVWLQSDWINLALHGKIYERTLESQYVIRI